MSVRIVSTAGANMQLHAVDTSWRANRKAADNRVLEEMRRLKTLLLTSPEIGTQYKRRGHKNLRWLRLQTTPYKLYYHHEPGTDVLTIVAVWSSAHPHGPPLLAAPPKQPPKGPSPSRRRR